MAASERNDDPLDPKDRVKRDYEQSQTDKLKAKIEKQKSKIYLFRGNDVPNELRKIKITTACPSVEQIEQLAALFSEHAQ